MSAAALQPSDQLWAEMRRAGQLFFSVGYPYHSRYITQPERAGFMLWRNEWGQVLMSITGPCKGKRQWQKTVTEGWRQALETIPADLFAWTSLLRDFGDYGTTYALHKLGRISACDTRVAIAEMTTRA